MPRHIASGTAPHIIGTAFITYSSTEAVLEPAKTERARRAKVLVYRLLPGVGEQFLRAIDKGLAKSRIGIALVTPALLKSLPAADVADKELSILLHRNQLVPIMHNTTFDALREVSPMLASRNGLDAAEMSMADVAAKLAELVALLGEAPQAVPAA